MSQLRVLHLEGMVLASKYRFVRRLGAGGYGEVWLAEMIDLRSRRLKDVAIKVFTANADDRDEVRTRVDQFSRESERTAKARRGQLFVEYYTYEMIDMLLAADGTVRSRTTNGSTLEPLEEAVTLFMLVMEFADGGALGPEYRNQYIVGAQDPSYLNHFIDVTTAIATLHAEGVIHRDIKDSNLLLFRRDNLVKVGDLGIAKALDQPFSTGVIGTPEYMSPEAFLGTDGPARDRYALACTLYSLLTGELPIIVDTPTSPFTDMPAYLDAWSRAHSMMQRPDAVKRVPTLISVNLSGLLKQMMAADPHDRPEDLRILLDALQKEKLFRFPAGRVQPGGIRPKDLPQQPIQRSRYSIDPKFRIEKLEEVPYVVFIDMDQATEARQGLLLAFAEEYFGDTYSLAEVYGRHDYILRVWSAPSRRLVEHFCEDVIRHVLYDNRGALSIMPLEEVVYPGLESKYKSDIDLAETKIRLNDAQLPDRPIHSPQINAAERWLRDHGVFVRRRVDSHTSHRLKAFTLVFPRSPLSQYEEEAMFAKIVQKLQTLRVNKSVTGISAMRRQFMPLHGLEPRKALYHIQGPVLVKYVAAKFEDVISVPRALLGTLDGQGIRTTTFLSTKRILIESDWVAPQ